jgi:hypothetical protein
MLRWPEAALLGLALAAPAAAQLPPPPPEAYAQQIGAVPCSSGEARVVGAYTHDGVTSTGALARFQVRFCFVAEEPCERFLNELRLDYPAGGGACRLVETRR